MILWIQYNYNSGLSYSILRFTDSLLVVESILSHFIRFSCKFPQFNRNKYFFHQNN